MGRLFLNDLTWGFPVGSPQRWFRKVFEAIAGRAPDDLIEYPTWLGGPSLGGTRLLPARRYTNLPLIGQGPGLLIFERSTARLGSALYNMPTSAGVVYVDDNPNVNAARFPIFPGGAQSFPAPFAPQNALYAVADNTHDLRVIEVVRL